MPKLPNKEKGAKALRFFNRHRGNKTVVVKAGKTTALLSSMPTVANKLTAVSAKIILYARDAKQVFNTTVHAGIHAVWSPTV